MLLVEDNRVNQKVAKRILDRLGHDCETADDGPSAIAAAERSRFDVILMDIQMPGMDGFQATAEIRASERARNLPRTPVIALTAHAMKGDRERCLESGMDAYLAKPITVDALRRALAETSPN